MAVTEIETPEPGEPLPRREQLDTVVAPRIELFGVTFTDEQYREELGLYIGRKILVTSTAIRHFKSPLGLTVKFEQDPVTIEQELTHAIKITGLPMNRDGQEALMIQLIHPRLGMIEPYVPLDRAVTQIHIPIE